MSDITDATSSTIPLTDNHGPVPPADYLPNVQPNYRLTDKNYLKWSQFVQTFLKGKGKLSHLLGSRPPKEDPKYAAWDEADSMVMSWLWNSMAPEISDTCMFLKTAQDIWDTCKQTYSRVHDAAQIYDIKTRISNTKQGTHSVTEYANILQNLWQELDYYQCIKMESSKDVATLRRFLEKERIYVFLAGLNIEFDAVRVQVVGKEDLPSLNEAIGIIRGEESRRGVMLESKTVERSAMIMKEAKRGGSSNNNNSYAGGWSETAKFGSRDPVVCTYCKKPYHTRDRCWKLHGKPSNLQNLQETNRTGTTRSNQGQAHISSSQPKGEIEVSSDNVEFNREQIAKLKQMLENLDKPSGLGNCSLASSDFRLPNQLGPRIFGCVAFVHVHSHQRGKLDPRALKCVFLGFSYTQKGYKCYHPSTKRFFVSTDVSFVEHESYFTATYLRGETSLTEDKQWDLFLLDLSTHTPVIPDPITLDPQTANPNLSTVPAEQAESSGPIVTTPQLAPNMLPPSEPTQSQGATRPLQVYTRREAPFLQPVQHQESDTDLGTDKDAEKIED
ncbi:hypothetical protein LWI29_024584 [Acer saccharum]|uniref:Retroviral polymerase SH3-like domain-containing protein n=1 Tax=Acer saccharum TaxID=4024 RepID=A0AA39VJ10_ACESA|nr:hypothetical protein LWI29_024584 [Acer saccharum]